MPKSEKRHMQIDFKSLTQSHKGLIKQEDSSGGYKASGRDAAMAFVRRVRSPHENSVDPVTDLKPLQLVQAIKSRSKTSDNIKLESPWESYEKTYELRLGADIRVTVAERRTFPYDEVSVRHFTGPDIEDRLHKLQQIQHNNLVAVLEIFQCKEMIYAVYEHMPVSLHHIASNPRLDEIRLAAILGQVSPEDAVTIRQGANCTRY